MDGGKDTVTLTLLDPQKEETVVIPDALMTYENRYRIYRQRRVAAKSR